MLTCRHRKAGPGVCGDEVIYAESSGVYGDEVTKCNCAIVA